MSCLMWKSSNNDGQQGGAGNALRHTWSSTFAFKMEDIDGYTEDRSLSAEVQSGMRSAMLFKGVRGRVFLIILPALIAAGLSSIYPVVVAVGIVVIPSVIFWIILSGKAGDKMIFKCTNCGGITERKITTQGLQYYVCHSCRVFAKGRDYSGSG